MAGLWPVCAALLVAPGLRLFPVLAPYDEQRLLELVACGAAVLLSAASPKAREAMVSTAARTSLLERAALGAAVALGTLSALTSAHARASLVDVAHTVLLLACVVAVAGAFVAEPRAARRLAAFTLSASIAIACTDLGARVVALDASGAQPVHLIELFAPFGHVRFFGQWATWMLPLAGLAAFVAPSRRSVRLAALALGSALWALVLVAGGRGTLVAQAAATGAVLLWFGRAAAPWARFHVAGAVGGVAVYVAGALVLPGARAALAGAAAHLASFSDSGRWRLWAEAWAMASADPLLGSGPRAFSYRADLPAAHPHDAVLQWAAEWGAPAALLLSAVIGRWLWRWLTSSRSALENGRCAYPAVRIALAAALVAAGLHALVCGVIVTPLSQLMAVLVGGWAAGAHHTDGAPAAAARRSDGSAASYRAARVWTAATVAAALACFAVIAPEVARAWSLRMPGDVSDVHLRPRYWSDETSVLRVGGAARPARRPLRGP